MNEASCWMTPVERPERMVELAHPLCVAFGQIVVDRHEMSAFAFEGIEINRQRRDERFAFAGLHFGDPALVQDHAADQLHVEMAHVQLAPGHLAADREGFRKNVVEGFADGQPLS